MSSLSGIRQKIRSYYRLKNKLAFPYRYLTASERSLPHFIIVGAMKAGTTSLFYYLSQHPELFASIRKEVSYFNGGKDLKVDNYVKGEA